MRPILVLALAIVACSADPPRGAPAAVVDDADCSFATPLVPGVPGSPGNLIPSDRNPNGISELALLMRQFVDDLREAREQIQAGTAVRQLHPGQRRMRCAWHTDPADRTKAFDERAQTYLAVVRAFDAAPSRATYNSLVAGCLACHTVSCPGPMELISAMVW